jgi:hypothetical protein
MRSSGVELLLSMLKALGLKPSMEKKKDKNKETKKPHDFSNK